MSSEFIQGFTLQATLIFGLGAQNLFLIDAGLKKQNHFLAATVSAICDFCLIFLGVAGAGSIFSQNETLRAVVTCLGILFLAYYGIKKIIEPVEIGEVSTEDHTIKKTIAYSLAFSLLNPHVYLDVLLIGSYSSQFSALQDRIRFGIGASFYSAIWFFVLVIFSATMRKFNGQPQFLRRLNFIAGVLLIYLAIKLSFELSLLRSLL